MAFQWKMSKCLCLSLELVDFNLLFLKARILYSVASSLLQGIFPTQGLNPGLLHFRQILYQLSHQGSPRIWSW